jgi:hypothetical protein
MGAPATICVDDNLAASEAGVSMGTTNHEAPARVQMEDGLFIQVLGRHNFLDDVLHEILNHSTLHG